MAKFFSEKDFEEAADKLEVETAVIKAVHEVETEGRSGFLSNGKPVILFEGHIFWKQLKDRGIDPQQFREGNETILYPSWTKEHYLGGAAEYDRLEQAKAIQEESALCSASWGMFQIMGFNYKTCDFDTVQDFVEAQEHSQGRQFMAFINFIADTPGHTALKRLDWRGFARYYNGPGYEKNKYHTKLEKAYQRFAA